MEKSFFAVHGFVLEWFGAQLASLRRLLSYSFLLDFNELRLIEMCARQLHHLVCLLLVCLLFIYTYSSNRMTRQRACTHTSECECASTDTTTYRFMRVCVSVCVCAKEQRDERVCVCFAHGQRAHVCMYTADFSYETRHAVWVRPPVRTEMLPVLLLDASSPFTIHWPVVLTSHFILRFSVTLALLAPCCSRNFTRSAP